MKQYVAINLTIAQAKMCVNSLKQMDSKFFNSLQKQTHAKAIEELEYALHCNEVRRYD